MLNQDKISPGKTRLNKILKLLIFIFWLKDLLPTTHIILNHHFWKKMMKQKKDMNSCGDDRKYVHLFYSFCSMRNNNQLLTFTIATSIKCWSDLRLSRCF